MHFCCPRRLLVGFIFLSMAWTPLLNAAPIFNFYVPFSKKEDPKVQTFLKTFESEQEVQLTQVFYKDSTIDDFESIYKLVANASSDDRTSLALVSSDFFAFPDGEHYKGIVVLGAFPLEAFQFVVSKDFSPEDPTKDVFVGYVNAPSAALWAAYQNPKFQLKPFSNLEEGLVALEKKEITRLVFPKARSLSGKELVLFKVLPGSKTPFRDLYVVSSSKLTQEKQKIFEKFLKTSFTKSESLSFMDTLLGSKNSLSVGADLEVLLNAQKPLMTGLLRKVLPDFYARGYTMDVPYEGYVISHQTPLPILYALSLKNYKVPSLNKPFTYLDLGTGQGFTVNILAALYPESEFWGVDLNHEHIENAKAFAKKYNLSNAHFIEAGFSEIDLAKLPKFDFIAMHGVLSWVNPTVRQQMIEVIQSCLKPVGIVYISYNALPGWSAFQPITTLMGVLASPIPGNSIEKFKKAFEEMLALREAGALFFKNTPEAFAHLDEIKDTGDFLYLTHEYLNKGSFPDYFKDVATSFKGIGLKFGASINVLSNFPEISMTPAAYKVFEPYENTPLAETIKDFIWNTVFRWDLFVGDGMSKDAKRQSNVFYYGVLNNIDYAESFSIADQTFDFNEGIYKEILLSLEDGPRSFEEICEGLSINSENKDEVFKGIQVLLGAERIFLFQKKVNNEYLEALKKDPRTIRFKIQSSFNRLVIEGASKKSDNFYVASDTQGSGYLLEPLNAIYLLALDTAPLGDEAAWIYEFHKSNNLSLPEGSGTSPEEVLPFLKDSFEEFLRANLKDMVILGVLVPEVKTVN